MSKRAVVWIGVFIGSIVGGYLPVLFGQSLFSYASVFGGGIGGFVGLWYTYKYF